MKKNLNVGLSYSAFDPKTQGMTLHVEICSCILLKYAAVYSLCMIYKYLRYLLC